jgi:hypothetical protein
MGYLGGSRALDAWSVAEWQRFQHLRQFPCWVPSVAHDNPSAVGAAAVARANEFGWWAENGSRVIIYDLETSADAAWWHELADATDRGGFWAVAYGSASTVGGNNAGAYWVANYNGVQTLPSSTAHGHQYAANVRFDATKVDYSIVDDWMITRGGVGARH